MKKERAARKERLALQVGIALTAGVFGAVPVAEGAPVVDKVVTAGTQVAQSGNVTDVTGTQANNIVKWQDFSVGEKETVRFDRGAKEKNYLNLVTGPNQSEIAGKIEGGKDVYLVNPHGVIFSHGAQVDVGNLYVSTENTEAALQAFSAGKTAGEVLTAGTANADVVNLGGIAASTVVVNGDNIRFLTDDVRATQVTLQAAKNIVQEQDAARSAMPGVLRAASPSAASPGYVLRAPHTENRQAIFNAEGLAAVKNNLSGSYSLEKDLTLNDSYYTPIGDDNGAFTGNFDGNFHTISGIQVSGGTYGGLFGLTSGGATIQNVGVKDGSVTAVYAGGIVGKAVSTTLTDVYNAGVSVTSAGGRRYPYGDFSVGGIAGVADKSTIKQVYNTGEIRGTHAAGLIGVAVNGTKLINAYNTGTAVYGSIGYAKVNDTSSISNVYTTKGKIASDYFKGSSTNAIFVNPTNTSASKYSDFDISSSGSDDTVWRIYEGHSLPLLRDFLRRGKGAVTVNYDYTHDGGNNYDSNNGSDLTLTYNNQDVKLSNINYTNANALKIDPSKITQDTGSLRNANVYSEKGETSNGQQAFYCTSQDGYDLVGNNVYINQREVNISGDSVKGKHITKVYDGKVDASDAVKALFNASDTSVTGLIAGDTTASLTTNDLKASFADKNVGVGKKVTANGTLTLTQTAHNYKVTGSGTAQLNNVTLTGDITPATLTLSLADGKTLTKVYEGRANAATKETVSSLFSKDKTVTGLKTDENGKTDDVALGFRNNDAKGTYGAKEADGTFTADGSAGAHDVELAGIQLSGADAGNYNLVDERGNIIWGEQYTEGAGANASGTLTAVGKTSGGTAYLNGTITKRNLTADGFTWYDGGTAHAVKDNTREYGNTSVYKDADGKQVNKVDGSSAGLVEGDHVAFTVQQSGTHFVHATVADGKVTVSNDDARTVKDANAIAYAVTVSGDDAKNYTLNGQDIRDGGTTTVYGEGHITPRTLNIVAGKGVDKVYDGTSDVVQAANSSNPLADGWVAYGDSDAAHHLIAGDGSQISLTGSHYAGADVAYDAAGNVAAQDITYAVSVLQDGADQGNYIFSASGTSTASLTKDANGNNVQGRITPAPISALTFQKVEKTYDTSADVRGKQPQDHIAITGGTWLKGEGKTATALTADEIADLLQVDAIKGQYGHKVGDAFTADAHARSSEQKDVQYTGIQLKNAKGNYTLSLSGTDAQGAIAYGTGVIHPLTITSKDSLTLDQAHDITKVYDHTTDVGDATHDSAYYVGKLNAKIPDSTDTISLPYTVKKAAYDNWNQGTGKAISYTLDVQPDANGDYTLADSLKTDGYLVYDKLTGTITPRHLIATVTNPNKTKVYDGKADVVTADGSKVPSSALASFAAAGGGEGIIAGDSVTNGTTAVYKDKNVGTPGITYTFALNNNDAGNYVLDNQTADGEGTITPRTVTLSFDTVDKAYDGTTKVKGDKYHLGNVVSGDESALSLSYDAAYENANVNSSANPNWVNYTKLALGGAAAGNYKLADDLAQTHAAQGDGTIHSAKVTKDDIKVTFGDITKVYDGSRNVSYRHDAAAYPGQQGQADQRDYLKGLSIQGISLGYGADKDYTLAEDALYNSANVADASSATYRFQLSKTMRTNFDFSGINDTNFFDLSSGVLTETTKASITPKTVTAALSGVTGVIEKEYDGKTSLPDGTDVTNRVTFTGLLAGDAQLGKNTGVYDTKDVVLGADGKAGTKNIIYTPTLTGTGASNYQLKLVSADGTKLAGTTLTGEGQGRILPRELTFTAGYTEKTYDATPDAKVINPAFQGFADRESLTPGSVNGKSLVTAQYGLYNDKDKTFTPDDNVEGNEDYKAVSYQNLQQALAQAAGQSDTIKASNYTIADTVYFAEQKKQGKIKRLALTAGDIKERWSSNITKQYDGTRDVDITDPEKNFQIYIDETTNNGKTIRLPQTVYLHYELGDGGAKYNSANVQEANEVTYDLNGLKNSDTLANNFTFTDGSRPAFDQYKGKFTLKNGAVSGNGITVGDGKQPAVVGITKRVLRVHANGHNDKIYDGSPTADAGHLVLANGTDGKLAAEIGEMLRKDGVTDFKELVEANYMATGGAQETAAAANVGAKHDKSQGEGGKVIEYTLDLTKQDGLTKNYALDTSQAAADGVTNQVTGDGTKGTYSGLGDIQRRVVYVSFADPKAENRKEYDGTPTVTDKADDLIRKFALSDEDAAKKTGIIHADKGKVSVTGTGTYDTPHVKRDDKSGEVQKGKHTVTYSGFTLKNADGSDNTNYEVAAADGRTDEQGNAVLVGEGTITPAKLHVSLKDEKVTQVYDNTTDVEDLDKYGEANIQKTEGDLKIRDTVNVKLSGKPQYDNKDANVIKGKQTENRSVTYELEWDNPDYELAVAQDAPSQKLHVEQEVSATDVGKARLVTDAATITPRTVTISANPDPAKWATRLYDGKSGGAADNVIENQNLKAGNLAQGEKLINLFLKPGATKESYLPETVLRSAYDSNPNAGKDGVAIDGDGNDLRNLREHTVTYTYTLQNPNYQLDAAGTMDGTASGTGVIRRKEITVTADPKIMTVGSSLPAFTGSASGFVSTDAAEQAAFEADLQFRPADGVVSPPVGKYGVYGWYRTQEKQEITVPAVLEDGKVLMPEHTEEKLVDVWKHKEGNLGLNYYFGQDQANDTALTVVARSGGGGGGGWTPVKPPVTPVKPPVTPVEPVKPAVPPRALEEALVPAKKFVPDGNSYHRASLDLHHEVVRTPVAGLEYTTGGINMGTVDSGSTETGTASLEGSGDVVNLGNAGSAVVDVTRADTSFTVSGEEAVRGVTTGALTALAVQTAGSGAASATGGAGVGSTGSMLSTEAVTADGHATTGAEPADAAAVHGGAPAVGVTLFHEASEGYPGHLAATEDAQLFDDAAPAVTAAGPAKVSLFDDGGEGAGQAASARTAADGAVSLFDDVTAAEPAVQDAAASGTVQVTTASSDDEEDEKEKEEAAHAAALKAKGADIGIESEGAGVNLAG